MKTGILPIVLAVFVIGFAPAAPGDIFYAATDGAGVPPYDSWFSAATDLQAAIDLAADTPGGPHQVRVKQGVYRPVGNPHILTENPRDFCFALRNNVEVYGGFAGDETSFDRRDPAVNQTILSGDRGDPAAWSDGTLIIDADSRFHPPPTGVAELDLPVLNNSDNLYRVIWNPDQIPRIDRTAVLDGFIIAGGHADGPIEELESGAGMRNQCASPTVTGCVFSGNRAKDLGGGIFNYFSAPEVSGCVFSGNQADTGAGICHQDVSVSRAGGAGKEGEGTGGRRASGPAGPPVVAGSVFRGNYADAGGGIANLGSSPVVTGCEFSGHYTDVGGGIFNFQGAAPAVTGCLFRGNSASSGGGIFNYDGSNPVVINSTFSGNQAREESGGSAVYNFNSFPVLVSCTLSENQAPGGGTVGGMLSGPVFVVSSIFWGNTGGEFSGFEEYTGVRYSVVAGETGGFGPGCLNSDPLLGSLGGHGGLTDCYPISAASPAIGAGAAVFRVAGDGDPLIYRVPASSPSRYRRIDDGEEYDPGTLPLVRINAEDQRGGARSGRGDIGSYEYGALARPGVLDYDGDGTSDLAVFRPETGLWAVRGVTRAYFGRAGDLPVPGDYTGDGTADPAIFRPETGLWAVRGTTRLYYGAAADIPVSGYYLDRRARPAVFRGAAGLWAVRGLTRVYFGREGDRPVPGDYDGGGRWSPAVFRPDSGLWAARLVTRVYFGVSGDVPVPGGYTGDGRDRPGIFRGSPGLWAVRGLTRARFGESGDLPVSR